MQTPKENPANKSFSSSGVTISSCSIDINELCSIRNAPSQGAEATLYVKHKKRINRAVNRGKCMQWLRQKKAKTLKDIKE